MVRTRIAPSPTGEDLHIGNLQTALFNWVYAKKHQGKFIVRSEDTDQSRLVKGAEARILQSLKDYGLSYDEGPDIGGTFGPYRQSERLDLYNVYASELVDLGAAYYCSCTPLRLDELRKKQVAAKQIPKYDRHCLKYQEETVKKVQRDENYVIRLKVPDDTPISFHDEIRGKITFNSDAVDDQVLIKSDAYPTYHMAVVVDDHLMKITHVIRGEDWISSTPKHVLLYKAFGWEEPKWAHTPLLRNVDKSKLSKRKNPVWAHWYLKHGYLPEAVLNYIALLGWSHPKQKEIFDLDELTEVFDLKDIAAVGPVFDLTKLEWMSGEYIRKAPIENLELRIKNFVGDKYDAEIIRKSIPLIRERIKKLSDYLPMCEFFFHRPEKHQIDLAPHKKVLAKVHDELSKVKEWKADGIGKAMQEVCDKEGIKPSDFFMWVRVAITGRKISPPLNESMEILGKKESLTRLTSLV